MMGAEKGKRGFSPGLMLALHASLLVSSLSGVCSKYAAGHDFFSKEFILWYAVIVALMFIYALSWQQILKRVPLTVAYANRPVNLIWGMIWGRFLFHEKITWNMIIGALVIFFGIFLVVTSDE
jgi:drug/metabolite transporter (DMT)-like permease